MRTFTFLSVLFGLGAAVLAAGDVDGTVVDAASGEPVEGAAVWRHVSVGTPFDRNQLYDVLETGADGRYAFARRRGRLRAVVAIAPGFYPGLARDGGRLALRRIPADPVPVRRGVVRIDAAGKATGFAFATGKQTGPDEADVVPVAGPDPKKPIAAIRARGKGRIWPVGEAGADRTAAWCRFFAAVDVPEGDGVERAARGAGLYFVRCRDGEHFAKLRIEWVSVAPDCARELAFRYAYQPAGKRSVPARCTPAFFAEHCLLAGARLPAR